MPQMMICHDVVIRGVGVVSSLGLDVETSCAAARAGLVRTQPQATYPVVAPDDMDLQELAVHELPFITRGFEGRARLGRLLEGALVDLRRRLPREVASAARFYLAVPDPQRLTSGGALQGGEQASPEAQPQGTSAESMQAFRRELGGWLNRVAANAEWPGPVSLRFVTTSGHAGIAEATMVAAQDLAEREDAHAIVAGVDTLIDTPTLAWLHACGRLKEPTVAAGVPAGEAAAAIYMTGSNIDASGMPEPLARVDAVAVEREAATLLSGGHCVGRSLADVIAAVQGANNGAEGSQPWIVTDHNGEPYRAAEWGHACSALIGRFPAMANAQVWLPASAFGDTGCASGGLAIATVCQAFARRYAPSCRSLVVSSSEDVGRSAMLLSRADSSVQARATVQ